MTRQDGARAGRALGTVTLAAVTMGSSAVAAVLAVARSLSPPTQRGIELVALTPVGLPVALVGLVGALLLLRRHRPLGCAGLVPAVGLAVLHGWWVAPQFAGEVPHAHPIGPRLVVMTQNFEEGDAGEVAALVRRRGVDVLVVTDASEDQVADLLATRIGDSLPYTTLDRGRGSVVWSRYRIASDVHISDGGRSRVVTLEVPGLRGLSLVALHPTSPHHDDGSHWQADWEQVLDRLRASYGDTVGGRVLVVGDLNATADHWPVRALVSMGFRDVTEQLNAGPAATWPANGTRSRFGIAVPTLFALDHVLTTHGLVPTDQVVVDAVGSDHRAVIATVAPAAR